MGVPAFYRWISEKYSKIIVDILEKRPPIIDGVAIPIDLTEPNPNEIEFDNLFIDMNGLIHPCSHPEDREPPKDETEMYANVAAYLDRLITAIRPRKLLYLAIDGVAPRAKMNQQRSRRFKTAQDIKEKKETKNKIMLEIQELGIFSNKYNDHPNFQMDGSVSNDWEEEDGWDSNVITPGTEFMMNLSIFIRYYILHRMNTNKYYQNIKVILSDASQPGEGEHKIMNYIRQQRQQEDYNPMDHHVLHGLDADLIMLALATHERRFTILREKIIFNNRRENENEVSEQQKFLDSLSIRNGSVLKCLHPGDEWVYGKTLQALHIHALREYLEYEFEELKNNLPFGYDFERIVDDFIFLCFFVGNDFLPSLPSLDIRDGALDYLIELYKDLLPSLGDYLTSVNGKLNLLQIDIILSKISEVEELIFIRKKKSEDFHEKKMEQRKAQRSLAEEANASLTNSTPSLSNNLNAAAKLKEKLALSKRKHDEVDDEDEASIKKRKTDEESSTPILSSDDKDRKELLKQEISSRVKQKEQEMINKYKEEIVDTVKLHEMGWKERYYNEPYKKKNIEEGGGLKKMCVSYIQGLLWVYQYYFIGCPSWNWYYPFHYAPFASDLININSYPIEEFELSTPFSPVEQLLSVLPASSSHALPQSVQWLMTSESSPIIDLYSDDIPTDPNGKFLPWLWILLLPFIDEKRIKETYLNNKHLFTIEDLKRNKRGEDILFIHDSSPIFEYAKQNNLLAPSDETDPDIIAYNKKLLKDQGSINEEQVEETKSEENIKITCPLNYKEHTISGHISKPPANFFAQYHSQIDPTPEISKYFTPIKNNRVVCFAFDLPPFNSSFPYNSKLLPLKDQTVDQEEFLSPVDKLYKKPPRLNKSGFNILELFRSTRSRNNNYLNPHLNNHNNPYSKYGEKIGGLNGYHNYNKQQQQQNNYQYQNNNDNYNNYNQQQQQQQNDSRYSFKQFNSRAQHNIQNQKHYNHNNNYNNPQVNQRFSSYSNPLPPPPLPPSSSQYNANSFSSHPLLSQPYPPPQYHQQPYQHQPHQQQQQQFIPQQPNYTHRVTSLNASNKRSPFLSSNNGPSFLIGSNSTRPPNNNRSGPPPPPSSSPSLQSMRNQLLQMNKNQGGNKNR